MVLTAAAALVPLALAAEVLAVHHLLLAAHVVGLLLLPRLLLLLVPTHVVRLLLEATRVVTAHVGLLLGVVLPVVHLLAILVVSGVVRLLIVVLHS